MDELSLILADQETKSPEIIKEKKKPFSFPSCSRFRLRLFASLLAQLLRGGIPILQALEILEEESGHAKEKEAIAGIKEEIRQGRSLSEAAAERRTLFPVEVVHLIEAGEMSGTLDRVLEELAQHLEKKEEVLQKMREAAAYPCLILALGIVTLFVLLHAVVPKLAAVYLDFGGELPAITKLILWLSEKSLVFFIGIACAGGLLGFFLKRNKVFYFSFVRKTPLLGDIFFKSIRYRFCSTLSLLLRSGIPIFRAFEVLSGNSPEPLFFKKDMEEIKEQLSQGSSLSRALHHLNWVNKVSLAIIRSGEESGKLPESLTYIAQVTQKEMEGASQFLLKLIEPLLILLVGGVVGIVVVGTLLPVFEMSGLLQ
jgi:type IV pilus assembly protein PilC